MLVRRRAFLSASLCSLLGVPLVARAATGTPAVRSLRLGIMPFNSTLALFKTHQPLRLYLQQQLGVPVELFTASDYVTFLNASLAGEYDLLITGPHFGVMCLAKGYEPLVRYRATLQPVFVVRRDGVIRQLEDLRGKRIGLSSRLSMSSIGGVKWLLDHGMHMGRDYQLFERSTHGAAVAAVAVGELDAALTTHTPLKQVPEDVRSQVTVLPLSVFTPHLMTLAHQRLGRAAQVRLRAVLQTFPETPEGQAFFAETGYEGYAAVTPQDVAALQPFVALTRTLLGHKQ